MLAKTADATSYVTVNIAQDFTEYPTGRYQKLGRGSGEQFRDEFLIPSLTDGKIVKVEIDGTAGYPASFLEEAFGGLIRRGFTKKDLEEKLDIVSNSPSFEPYQMLVWQFIDNAEKLR